MNRFASLREIAIPACSELMKNLPPSAEEKPSARNDKSGCLNILLSKRGVKDLFYGNITIPSDVTYIYNNTQGYADGATVSFVGGGGGGSGRYCDYDPLGGGILIQKYHDETAIRYATFSLKNQIPSGKVVYINARINDDSTGTPSFRKFTLYGYTASKQRVLSIVSPGGNGIFTVNGTTTGVVSYMDFSCSGYTNTSQFRIWLYKGE